MKGKFITFEGTEGVGKSTQTRLLAEYLEKTGQPYIITREPGGDKIAEKIRRIILDADNVDMADETEALLYAAARAQHVKNVILPALNEGEIVLCDRFVHSSIAYQCYGRGLPLQFVLDVNAYALKNCPPDCVVLMEMSPKDAFARKGGADKTDRLEQSGDEFFEKVNKAYENMRNDREVLSVDPVGTKEEVLERIIEGLKERGLIK